MTAVVTGEDAGITLSAFLKRRLGLSSASVRRLRYREGGITRNGAPVPVKGTLLAAGDVIVLDVSDRDDGGCFSGVIPVDLPLKIIYEDALITVCDKPAGMPAHPVRGHLDDTLGNALAYRAEGRGQRPFVFRPVMRLDSDTSGVAPVARDFVTAGRMSDALTRGLVKKIYYAVCEGIPGPASGTVDAPIARTAGRGPLEEARDVGRQPFVFDEGQPFVCDEGQPFVCDEGQPFVCDEGQPFVCDEGQPFVCDEGQPYTGSRMAVSPEGKRAVTHYETVAVNPGACLSLVRLRPETGRTHQIRVHMAYIGCPLLGDFIYGRRSPLIGRHALHCAEVSFPDPSVPLPPLPRRRRFSSRVTAGDGKEGSAPMPSACSPESVSPPETEVKRLIFRSPLPRDMADICREYFPGAVIP
ncbi:MAG: RluA family pseudouridine synthase [Clostridia bacterium]|nr:RluA family pseudouridine synthase [Clostridia bacterium]